MLAEENEQKLVVHIKTLQSKLFPLAIANVRTNVFQFAEILNLFHRFIKTIEKGGYD